MPLFVKAGAIIPIGPIKQYTGEKSDALTVLRIYPGADGQFR
jgi:alpha-D-xyloside xylohydrolase